MQSRERQLVVAPPTVSRCMIEAMRRKRAGERGKVGACRGPLAQRRAWQVEELAQVDPDVRREPRIKRREQSRSLRSERDAPGGDCVGDWVNEEHLHNRDDCECGESRVKIENRKPQVLRAAKGATDTEEDIIRALKRSAKGRRLVIRSEHIQIRRARNTASTRPEKRQERRCVGTAARAPRYPSSARESRRKKSVAIG